MARSVKATDEIALVAMSQKVSERYLNLKGRKKKRDKTSGVIAICTYTLETLLPPSVAFTSIFI